MKSDNRLTLESLKSKQNKNAQVTYTQNLLLSGSVLL